MHDIGLCIYVSAEPYVHAMGWLRLVGSSKLYVSFAEYNLFYRALLHKRSISSRSLLIVATPYRSSVSTEPYIHDLGLTEPYIQDD